MNHAKRANNLFMVIVLLSVAAHFFLIALNMSGTELPILLNLLFSQSIILVPGLIFFVMNREQMVVRFGKIKFLTVIMLVIFTELLMPLISTVNAFSQLFTENAVVSISDQVVSLPFPIMLLIIGILGPMSEEFVFRGLIFMGLKKSTHRFVASGLVSALFFGFMHMNLNQCMYAFVLGFVFALIDDALDSIWPSVIVHCVVNSQNTILVYLMNVLIKYVGEGESIQEIAETASVTKLQTLMMVGMLGMVAMFTTTLAALLFYAICSYEKKTANLKGLFIKNREAETGKVLYITGIIGIVVCFFVMFLLEPIVELINKLNL